VKIFCYLEIDTKKLLCSVEIANLITENLLKNPAWPENFGTIILTPKCVELILYLIGVLEKHILLMHDKQKYNFI